MVQLIDKSLRTPFVLQNIGAVDRTLRVIIGFGMIGVWFFYPIGTVSLWIAALPLLGIVPVLSGVIGWDPFYALFGTKSCGKDEQHMCGTYPDQLSHLVNPGQPKTR